MKPYYEDDLVTLYHGDCLELADLWTCADVLVTDPPYGMSYESGWTRRTSRIEGDESTRLRDEVLNLWGDRPALLFGRWSVDRPPSTRMLLTWEKGDHTGMGDLSLPWKSDDLSAAIGITPPDKDRHTALGDARWAKTIYERIVA